SARSRNAWSPPAPPPTWSPPASPAPGCPTASTTRPRAKQSPGSSEHSAPTWHGRSRLAADGSVRRSPAEGQHGRHRNRDLAVGVGVRHVEEPAAVRYVEFVE